MTADISGVLYRRSKLARAAPAVASEYGFVQSRMAFGTWKTVVYGPDLLLKRELKTRALNGLGESALPQKAASHLRRREPLL